ncbi:response regulator [Paenibacillus rhizophilus]|uniref:Response regulator n=1 Tax=Paenibacillus rhizophilus TaxID=1850366 RepID=A0A3N9P143_9BACL|nr:response regulator [Paenibacillus rhizophilus]RQW09575.1 response regulator [Paenibacillus rhizophilus]
MYRVLIVDDEPITRNGIEAFIDWEKEGLSVEASCANGAAALTVLENRPIDILITDIQMPLMNGIELMKQAFQLYPWLKVIMISSYSDFEYVKEGLKLGAVDYLLKSALEPAELLAVVHRCISMLKDERRKEVEFQEGAIYRERKSTEQDIKRLIVQEQEFLPLIDWAPAWFQQRYACVYLILDGAGELKGNYGHLYVQLLLEDLQELFYRQIDEGAAMLMGESGMFLVFPDNVGDAELRIRYWKQTVEMELELSISAGFTIEQGICRLLNGLAGSRMACQRRFLEGLGGIYVWEGSTENKGTAQVSTIESELPDWKSFFEIIRNGDPISSAMENAMQRWKGMWLNPEQVKHEANELFTGIYEQQAVTGLPLSELLDLLERTETLDQILSILKHGLEDIGKTFIPRLADKGNGGELIAKALEYITNHYSENLTLQIVADTVYLSKNYFSLLFKKQTGQNFIDYLIELRIREAKRLLAEEDVRISDISEIAGFNDVNYFRKLFKKMTGLTPLEYRERHQGAGSQLEQVTKQFGEQTAVNEVSLEVK